MIREQLDAGDYEAIRERGGYVSGQVAVKVVDPTTDKFEIYDGGNYAGTYQPLLLQNVMVCVQEGDIVHPQTFVKKHFWSFMAQVEDAESVNVRIAAFREALVEPRRNVEYLEWFASLPAPTMEELP